VEVRAQACVVERKQLPDVELEHAVAWRLVESVYPRHDRHVGGAIELIFTLDDARPQSAAPCALDQVNP